MAPRPTPAALRSPIPTALRPVTTTVTPVTTTVTPVTTTIAQPPQIRHKIHVALIVPDERLYRLIKDHAFVLGPTYENFDVALHVIIDDKKHRAAGVAWNIRLALAELGLVFPDQVGMAAPAQVTLGWPEEPTA